MTEEECKKLEEMTRDQAGGSSESAQMWLGERRKRLTSSNFGSVMSTQPKTDTRKKVAAILYNTFQGNEYTRYGSGKEDEVRQKMAEEFGQEIKKSGLVVSAELPFLAASPGTYLLLYL